MTIHYISPSGNDTNNGKGPDASDGTNKPWRTLNKAMTATGAGSSLPADTVYIAPGYYYATATVVISAICSVGSPTMFYGDPTNAQGFKDSGGVLLPPGIPWLTGRTSGQGIDGVCASSVYLIDCRANDPAGLQFKNLAFENQNTRGVFFVDWAGSTDILVEDCYFSQSNNAISFVAGVPTAARNITFRRYVFV